MCSGVASTVSTTAILGSVGQPGLDDGRDMMNSRRAGVLSGIIDGRTGVDYADLCLEDCSAV